MAGRDRAGPSRAGPRPDLHQQGRRRAGRAAPPGAGRGSRRRSPTASARRGDADGVDLPRLRRAVAARARPADRRGAEVTAARRRDALPARRAGAAARPWPLPRPDQTLSTHTSRPRHPRPASWRSTSWRPTRCGSTTPGCSGSLEGVKPIQDVQKAAATARRRLQLADVIDRYCRPRRTGSTLSTSATRSPLLSRLAREHPAVGLAERERFRVVLLDEYQDTSVRPESPAPAPLRWRPPGHRGRRPLPGDLRLARGERAQHRRVRRRLPAHRRRAVAGAIP